MPTRRCPDNDLSTPPGTHSRDGVTYYETAHQPGVAHPSPVHQPTRTLTYEIQYAPLPWSEQGSMSTI